MWLSVLVVAATALASDEACFKQAERERASGHNAEAVRIYREVFTRYPDSARADEAKFMCAMGSRGAERLRLLAELDKDGVKRETRSAALYNLAVESSNTELFAKCVKLDPHGRYAPYANLKYGLALSSSEDPLVHTRGLEILLGIAFEKGPLANEALFLVAIQSYRDKRYTEARKLFKRYVSSYPNGERFDEARSMSVWCDFMEQRYDAAAAACGEGEIDDLAYIKASCAYAKGEDQKALVLFRQYLKTYPEGRFRDDAELVVSKLAYEEAQRTGSAADIAYWKGMAAIRDGDNRGGIKLLEEAVSLGIKGDESREARLLIADRNLRLGKIELARGAYRKLIAEGACVQMSMARIASVGRLLDGDEAESCARMLLQSDEAEFRQTGWEILGECEEARGKSAAAMDMYRKCLAESAKGDCRASAALRLGKLEFAAKEFELADSTLRQAITLNEANDDAKAETYLTLAKNAEAKGDRELASSYATIVISLFGDTPFADEARRLMAHSSFTNPHFAVD